MGYLLKISFRNLSRHKLRSFISILAIAVVVTIVIFSRGLMSGMMDSALQSYIDNNLGHVRTINEGYEHREMLMTLEHTVSGFDEQGASIMANQIRELPDIEHVLPRLKFGAMASVNDRLVRMAGMGIDTDAEALYGALTSDITKGNLPESRNEIVVGKGLLNKLNAELGDRVTFIFSDVYQSMRGFTFTIVGVRDSGIAAIDDTFFYLPLTSTQDILYLDDEVTEILVFGTNIIQTEVIGTQLTNLFTEAGVNDLYEAIEWDQADPLLETLDVSRAIMDIVYIFFIILGAIVVISTLTMIVRERTKEIGMMSALGLKGKDILKVFTFEGAFMGLFGSIGGVIVGGLITWYFSVYGLHVDVFANAISEMDVLFEPVFYTEFSVENLAYSFILGFVITTLSCIYPARQAARLEPVKALHIDA